MKSIIMAGGSGTRLWPFSRKNFPKQFLSIVGEDSFIQTTAKRLAQFTASNDIFVVAGESYRFNIKDQLTETFDTEYNNLISEPMGRNTAPAIALTVKYMMEKETAPESEILFFSPADHIIEPESVLRTAVEQSVELARGHIITFGIVPDKPETGYGYVELGVEKGENISKVSRFVEKPDKTTAQKYLEAGNYMWNSGMFMFSIGTIISAFKIHHPELADAIREMSYDEMVENYENFSSISIDYAVMEKADNILCHKLDIGWNDIGSWDSLYDMLDKDENGNAILGDVEVIDTTNSLIITNRNLTTAIGMNNVAIINTEDATLVSDRKKSQKVKELVNVMKEKKRPEVDEHVTTYRPWGNYTVLEEGPRYKIKRIEVLPGGRLSLQKHKHRSEHWVVVKGLARVEIGGTTQDLHENESVFVPIYVEHRLLNPGHIPVEIIEVQSGEYVGEDDIERLEDNYGRVDK